MKIELTRLELDVIGRMVDSNRDAVCTRLINLEAIKENSKMLNEMHKRYSDAWLMWCKLSDKLDKIRDIEIVVMNDGN